MQKRKEETCTDGCYAKWFLLLRVNYDHLLFKFSFCFSPLSQLQLFMLVAALLWTPWAPWASSVVLVAWEEQQQQQQPLQGPQREGRLLQG